ncbi:MAG: NADH-quinone oxidoreductase subunit J [Bacteroidetes bacterium]|nr:NADH-quinone oxidoreductase subunit J [Bacteroidota bacterium]
METLSTLTTPDWLFYLFAVITVASAAFVAFTKNVVYAAFALLFTFFGVAGLYVLLNSDFLAVTQILVYVGGILVLILFGVMLTNRSISVDIQSETLKFAPALIVTAALLGTLAGFYTVTDWFFGGPGAEITATSTAPNIGNALVTTHALPFEVASVVLLVALVGAAMIARRDK